MATATVFNNAILQMVKGAMNFPDGANTTYKAMLLKTKPSSALKADTLISDLTGRGAVEVDTAGTNYTAGGKLFATVNAAINTSNGIEVSFSELTWTSSTFSAVAAIIYRASDNKLVAYIDFGTTISSSSSTWYLSQATPLRIQN